MSKKLIAIVAVAVVTPVVLACSAYFWTDHIARTQGSKKYPTAGYRGFSALASVYPYYDRIYIDPRHEDKQDLYIMLPDGSVHLIWGITEEIVADVAESLGSPVSQYFNGELIYDVDKTGGGGRGRFGFRDGELQSASFHSRGSQLCRFSSSPEGPFLELPIEYSKLIELFGQPVEWRKAYRKRGFS